MAMVNCCLTIYADLNHIDRANETTPNRIVTVIDQHLLQNDQCALNYDNKRFSTLISRRLLLSRPGARFYAGRKSLFTLSNSFDNNNGYIWPPAALFLTFVIAKSFFGSLYNNSVTIGS